MDIAGGKSEDDRRAEHRKMLHPGITEDKHLDASVGYMRGYDCDKGVDCEPKGR